MATRRSRSRGGGADAPATDLDRFLPGVDLDLLSGPPLRARFLSDVEGAESTLRMMTADLKLAQMGRRRDLVDVLAKVARSGVQVEILASATTGPLREKLVRAEAADLPGLAIRLCSRNHAKVFLIDDAIAYVGSANLTGKGLGAMASAGSINVEVMVRAAGKSAVALIEALRENVWNPTWSGGLCRSCSIRRKGRCDGLLDKFQILDLEPA